MSNEDDKLDSSKDTRLPIEPLKQSELIDQKEEEREEEGSASFFSTCLNLLKSIIGAGILAIPLALKRMGYVPGLLIMGLAALLSGFGLYLLSVVIARSSRNSTFSSVAKEYYPKGAIALDVAIIVKCMGVGMSYVSVVGEVIPDIIRGFNPRLIDRYSWLNVKAIWVWITIGIMAPVVSMRKIDSLKYTSFFGMAAVSYLLGISIYQLAMTSTIYKVDAFAPISIAGFTSFSVFVFAFTCHQNLFPIQNEARDKSSRKTLHAILLSIGGSLSAYSLFGVFSVLSNPEIKDKILSAYPIDKLPFIFARIWYAILLAFSFPLQSYPTRSSMEKIFTTVVSKPVAEKYHLLVYWGSTLLILGLCGTVASLPISLDTFLTIVGSTASPVICYFLPALLFIKMTKSNYGHTKRHRFIRHLAKVLLVASVFIILLSTSIAIVKIAKK
jgi:amino acid permease